jgi:hypothetical protein
MLHGRDTRGSGPQAVQAAALQLPGGRSPASLSRLRAPIYAADSHPDFPARPFGLAKSTLVISRRLHILDACQILRLFVCEELASMICRSTMIERHALILFFAIFASGPAFAISNGFAVSDDDPIQAVTVSVDIAR